MKKRNFNILILVLLAIIISVFVFRKNEKPAISKMFSVENPELIDKIFISNKQEGTVLLEKKNGKWIVNGKYEAYYPAMELLLFETLKKVRVKGPVPSSARLNVISSMATQSTKVEIYIKGEKINEFYVGQPTNDMTGTYMYKKGSKDPYITHIPGFEGFLSTRYPATEKDWINKVIFDYNPEEITSIVVDYPLSHTDYFEITRKNNKGDFDIFTSDNSPSGKIYYPAVKQYFEKFKNIQCEGFASFSKNKKDSLINSTPFCIIKITDFKNKQNILKVYRRKSYSKMHGLYDNKGNELAYDPVRYNAILNNSDRVLIIQDIVFNQIMLKFSDFLAKN